MKTRVQHTISEDLIRRLDTYIDDRSRILGGSRSRSSLIEEAVESSLSGWERELHGSRERDAAIVR
jgi:metal-responsive CopG/Arc/MetJ family transcriptional regulator